jgi:dienelactone hydrolase
MRSPRRILGISLLACAVLAILLPALLRPTDPRSYAFSLAPAHAQQSTHRLEIVGGSGSGTYPAGAEVPIEVWRMPDARVFRQWETGSDRRIDPGFTASVAHHAHLSLRMPAADLIITAGLQSAPLWAPIEIAGPDFGAALLHLPQRFNAQRNPYLRGLLVLLHDAGQGRDYWMRSPEARLILRAAAGRDFGILIPESLDRRAGWSLGAADPATNADLARLSAAIAAVSRGHWQGKRLPTILLGQGQGGDFASLAARPESGIAPAAILIAGATGLPQPAASTGLPSYWIIPERDAAIDQPAVEAAAAELRARGLDAAIAPLAPWPVYPRRFWRIEGMTAADSEDLHQALVAAGVLDAAGQVLVDPDSLTDPSLIPQAYRVETPWILEQLRLGWAGHALGSRGIEAALDWADRFGSPEIVPQPTPEPTRMAYAGSITVIGGTHSVSPFTGDYDFLADRDIIHVWSAPDPPDRVFDRWQSVPGSRYLLGDARARHVRVRIGGAPVVTATWRLAPDWTPESSQIEGRQVYLHLPPEPVGLIFFFHGAGGSSDAWIAERRLEARQMLRDAVARGYGVMITESGNRQARQWDTEPDPNLNPDIQYVAALRRELVETGRIPDNLPTFGLGMSNGGGFVTRVADALGWQGAAVYAAAARRDLAAQSQLPVIWHLAENDRRVSNMDAVDRHQRWAARGIPTELYVLPPAPLHALQFSRIPGIEAPASRQIHAALDAAGLLDRGDFLLRSPDELPWRTALDGLGLSTDLLAQVGTQLDLAHSEHQLFADQMHWTLDFFDRFLQEPGPLETPTAVPTGTPGDPPTATRPSPTTGPTPTRPREGATIYLPWLKR